MAKRKEPPAEEGSPAWMSTFSDLMNLLMCFFVLLFASSTMDAGKIQKIAASFNNMSFSILEAGSISLVEGQIISGGVTQLPGIESMLEYIGVSSKVQGNNSDMSATGSDQNAEGTASSSSDVNSSESSETEATTETIVAENSTETTTEMSQEELLEQMEEEGAKQSAQMYDEITEIAESYSIDDRVAMDFNSQYVSIDLNGAILFDPGSADIRKEATMFMDKVSSILSRYQDSIIEIEGHSDSVPIHSAKFENNLYLSTARASKVYEFVLDRTNLKKENMKVAGYGDTHPIASNNTAEGRAKNRRVTIKIYNSLNSDSVTKENEHSTDSREATSSKLQTELDENTSEE